MTVLGIGLIVGCGGSQDDGDGGDKKEGAAKPTEEAQDKEVTREVTLQVEGEGQTQVMFVLGSNKTEQVSLPWEKTEKVTLEGAEVKVGVPVSIVPGSTQGSDGQLQPAPCVIKIDGKKVADNQGGESEEGCNYTLK